MKLHPTKIWLGAAIVITLTAFACGDSNTGAGGPTSGGATDGGSSKNRDGGGTSTGSNDGGTSASQDAGGGGTTSAETCQVESSPSNYCYCDDSTVHSTLASCPSGYSCCIAFDSHSCNCSDDDESTCASDLASEPTWTRVSACP